MDTSNSSAANGIGSGNGYNSREAAGVASSHPSQMIPSRGRNKRDKIALVLAGGGIAGAFYEIGALRAIDDMLVDLTVNDFDVFVGTSAGSLVCSLVANGLTPHEIMQGIDNRHPQLRGARVGDLLQISMRGVARRMLKLPKSVLQASKTAVTRWGEFALSDMLWELADIMPAGLYNSLALECYVRDLLEQEGRTNQFKELAQELYIVATELDCGQRAVFGPNNPVAISQAVAASSAVPVIYRPVRIGDVDYVDGSLHGAASLDLAIEAGAKLVVCVNPMAPLDASSSDQGQQYIRKHGLKAVINQSVRTLLHSTIRYHIKNLQAKYPDVDIILIQPKSDDYQMFSYNPMHYGSRLTVAEHGFESVTVGLTENFEFFDNVLSRHNIRFTKDLVVEELDEIRASGDDPKVVQHIIERDSPHTMISALNHLEGSLDRLDIALDTMRAPA